MKEEKEGSGRGGNGNREREAREDPERCVRGTRKKGEGERERERADRTIQYQISRVPRLIPSMGGLRPPLLLQF